VEDVMADRGPFFLLALGRDLLPTYLAFRRLPAEDKRDVEKLLPLADQALGVMESHQMTIAEQRALLKDAGPFVSFFAGSE
jgi:hypothetical protein